MLLKSLSYSENMDKPEFWKVEGLSFDDMNLIVGKNASGKSRVIRILDVVAKMISGRLTDLFNGRWELSFNNENETYLFSCYIDDRIILEEKIVINGFTMLDRQKDRGSIFDMSGGKKQQKEYSPPIDKFTVQVRRDKKEYPFLEDLFLWAKEFHAFCFSSSLPTELTVGESTNPLEHHLKQLDNFSRVPQLFKLNEPIDKFRNTIVSDLIKIGYLLDNMRVSSSVPHMLNVLSILVKEKDLDFELKQMQMSTGMYRAISVVVILNHLINLKKPCTFCVDDIGDGLDYERSFHLIKLITMKITNTQIQVILTSNDRHLLNGVDVKFWNILERKGGSVTAYNYFNNKEIIDKFEMTGLSSFDLFSGKMYKNDTILKNE